MKHKIFRIPIIVWGLALLVFITCLMFSLTVFEGIPHVHDEAVYIFQSKILILGRTYVPSPPSREAFDYPHMINNGKWYGQYPPGYPLLLVPWVRLGIPWLFNPIMASIAIVVFFLLGREVYSRRIGVFAALVGALSIWNIVMSSTMLSHTSGMLFISLFLLGMFRLTKRISPGALALTGIGWGMAFLIRPYTTALISLPFFIHYGIVFLKQFPRRIKSSIALALILMIFVSLLLGYNHMTNGNCFRMGYTELYGPDHNPGFGRSGYLDKPHSPFLGAQNLDRNIRSLNSVLLGWPITSLWPLLFLLLAWKRNPKSAGTEFLLLSGFLVLVAGYFIYWAFWLFLGPRMLFESLPIMALLIAKGLSEAAVFLGRRIKFPSRALIYLGTVMFLFSIYGFAYTLPHWIRPRNGEWVNRVDHSFQGVNAHLNNRIKRLGLHNAMVFINMIYEPLYIENHWWGSGFIFNDPLLRRDIIYANAREKDISRVIRNFPDRRHFIYVGTLEKGLLIPLESQDGSVTSQQPIPSPASSEKCVDLINHPRELFQLYSREFEAFIDSLHLDLLNPAYFNISHILRLAEKHQKNNEFESAAFCYEAALQIEKNPENRYHLLNKLSGCYIETGRESAATKILSRASIFDRTSTFKIFPEKGF